MQIFSPLDGGCSCGVVRYRMHAAPMIVHCCHCRCCQLETGSAFAINALLEVEQVELLCGQPRSIQIPSASGRGQRVVRCPQCLVALWSHYAFAGVGEYVCFVRVGTLDKPELVSPNVHIFTASKIGWVSLPEGVPVFPEYYDAAEVWSADSRRRRAALIAQHSSYQ